MKKAFTLVEMLVVIGIIGILAAALAVSFGGGTESARNAQCLTNMKNLASACHSYGMVHEHFPLAGSIEKLAVKTSGATATKAYYEHTGWLSWFSDSAYANGAQSHTSNYGWFTSCYNQEDNVREYCITNGALFKFISGNRKVYQCPSHVLKYSQTPPAWSYVMNSYFGWDSSKGSNSRPAGYYGIRFGESSRTDRRLLFAEIPFMGVETSPNTSQGSGTECDCVLQYRSADGGEVIGFNHASGKKSKFAHVVFADGHTEQITWPKSGLNNSKLRELTEWLCTAKDFAFDGQNYNEIH